MSEKNTCGFEVKLTIKNIANLKMNIFPVTFQLKFLFTSEDIILQH